MTSAERHDNRPARPFLQPPRVSPGTNATRLSISFLSLTGVRVTDVCISPARRPPRNYGRIHQQSFLLSVSASFSTICCKNENETDLLPLISHLKGDEIDTVPVRWCYFASILRASFAAFGYAGLEESRKKSLYAC